jgi:hypothetical protein
MFWGTPVVGRGGGVGRKRTREGEGLDEDGEFVPATFHSSRTDRAALRSQDTAATQRPEAFMDAWDEAAFGGRLRAVDDTAQTFARGRSLLYRILGLSMPRGSVPPRLPAWQEGDEDGADDSEGVRRMQRVGTAADGGEWEEGGREGEEERGRGRGAAAELLRGLGRRGVTGDPRPPRARPTERPILPGFVAEGEEEEEQEKAGGAGKDVESSGAPVWPDGPPKRSVQSWAPCDALCRVAAAAREPDK